MSQLFLIILAFAYLVSTFGDPIKDGVDVGKISTEKGLVVTGQNKYPYVVHIRLMQINKGHNRIFTCTGVIIGKTTVLTAAHCFHGLSKLIVQVHGGIVDINLEQEKGQRKVMKDFFIHEEFKEVCRVGNKYCTGYNDLAIIWLHEGFEFGPNVKKAKLNSKEKKPENKKGWILGWGKSTKNSHMLKRGLMEVLPQEDCEKFSQHWYIPETFLCLKSQIGLDTGSEEGDSGGPLVISEVVYGICNQVLSSESSYKTINVYTDVARYNQWILENLRKGPPKERNQPKKKGH